MLQSLSGRLPQCPQRFSQSQRPFQNERKKNVVKKTTRDSWLASPPLWARYLEFLTQLGAALELSLCYKPSPVAAKVKLGYQVSIRFAGLTLTALMLRFAQRFVISHFSVSRLWSANPPRFPKLCPSSRRGCNCFLQYRNNNSYTR